MTKLHLADGLSLPADLATHVTLIAGKRGSGKTNTAKRVVEQLHRARVPFGVLDPVDVWWGLKAGRDGAAAGGLEGVYVFGGKHAEYPLAPTGGAFMADLFVDYRISAVMEMREWSGADRARFVTAFAHRLLERNTEPFALIAEEAHDLIPQVAMENEKPALGAMLRLIKLGRSGGIGLVELTQRLAALNKTATTQADVLVMHRTTGPQDRKALNDWIAEHHSSDEEAREFLAALPTLKTGEAFVWGPDFPEDKPLGLQRHRILECETFNSHATPKVGEKRSEPKELRPADLERLAKAMAATVEKAKQDDPAELRKRIRELERAVGRSPAEPPQPKTVEKRVEVPVLKEAQIARLEKAIDRLDKLAGSLVLNGVGLITDVTRDLRSALSAVSSTGSRSESPVRSPRQAGAVPAGHVEGTAVRAGSVRDHDRRGGPTAPSRPRRESAGPARTTDGVSAGPQRIIDAIAYLESIGAAPHDRRVAGLAGVSPRSSTWRGYKADLRRAGLITPEGDPQLTEEGRGLARLEDVPTTSDEIQTRAMEKLSTGARKLLRVLVDAFPNAIERAELAERGEISAASSTFRGYMAELNRYGCLEGRDGGYLAASWLFLER